MNQSLKKPKQAPFSSVVRTYGSQLKHHKLLLVCMGIGILLMQVADLAAPLYMRRFFNTLATQTPSNDAVHTLLISLMFVVGAWVVQWIGSRINHLSVVILESRVMRDLYDDAFATLLEHSHDFFISNFAGSLTHKIGKFARAFERLFDALTGTFIPTILFVTGAIVVLFIRHAILGVALLVWTIGFLALQFWISKKFHPAQLARSLADTAVTANVSDVISNHATVAMFAGVPFERSRFKETVRTWQQATLRAWSKHVINWSVTGLCMIVIETLLLYWAIRFWNVGLLTIGDFVLIQAYLLSVFDRLSRINHELRSVYDAVADAGEMVAILETPRQVADAPHAPALDALKGAITFDHVSFYFNSSRPIFSDFSLTIAPQEKVAFVGSSGAGKSTITKLLLRLYDVKHGSVSIDGQNIAEVSQDSLRSAIAYVPQEPILFHRSLMENIRYGRRTATDEEVIEAAKQAHCHEFISALPEKYNTLVGERGVKLSGGERQRVAIARAILKKAPILVLDEATSSLDSESEALIQQALETLMQGKTVIVIAHRLSTIMKMDRIIVLQDGSIAAQGSHESLLAQGGLYQTLWNIQAGGFMPTPYSEELEESSHTNEELARSDEERYDL